MLKFFSRQNKETLDKGLEKSKSSFFSKLGKAVVGKSTVDEDVLDELEEILITSDVGVDTTIKIIGRIEQRVAQDKYLGTQELDKILKEEIAGLLGENTTEELEDFYLPPDKKPYIMLVVGVNGVGKTTTIGKLAAQFKNRGKKVVLGAADTFRAAAVDQLKLWGERVGVPVVSHGMNTDPASVAYDAVKEGVETGADLVIIDTAGRLHTKVNLMNELSKIRRVIQKFQEDAPHEPCGICRFLFQQTKLGSPKLSSVFNKLNINNISTSLRNFYPYFSLRIKISVISKSDTG
jgi:fused signal recognition particle receptor